MSVLITGVAGFIGFHVCRAVLDRGEEVLGVDNLNHYYDVSLKEARLAILSDHKQFSFERIDIADISCVLALSKTYPHIDRIIHLAAEVGVREGFSNPEIYIHGNVKGQLAILELARQIKDLRHLVYASSSTVYYNNKVILPSSIEHPIACPISFYGLTKWFDELMTEFYSQIYQIPATGLRFFTVYGPWSRPDMALFIFTRAILNNQPIHVYNYGNMKRDFTFIDDIVQGIMACLDRPPQDALPHRIYNLGSQRSESLMRLIALIEQNLGQKAQIEFAPLQPGDVTETHADIEASRRELGFEPSTTIDEGIPQFIDWYRRYYGI